MPNLNKRFVNAVIFLSLLLTGAVVARADVKITTRQTTSGQTMENTTLIKGKRQRTESNGGQFITIQQCDLRRDLQIMPQAQVYRVTRYDQPAVSANSQAGMIGPTAALSRGGVVTSTITSRDTGERRQMFGYTARHIITIIDMSSSPDACSQVNTKMEIDGWYIDAEFVLACDADRYANMTPPSSSTGCQDRYQTKQVGATVKRGYPVVEKTTMTNPGQPSFTMTNEVVELSQAILDASLFDVPAGYREVQDFSAANLSDSQTGQRPIAASTNDRRENAPAASTNQPAPQTPRHDPLPKVISTFPRRPF